MKNRRPPNLVLNLENLNCEDAKNSPYVLTSPRSLEACKVMGIKPVELLYRSVSEVREQLNECATLDRVLTVYQRQEKSRRSKLEACQTVRDHLVAFSTPSSSPSPESCSLKENINPSLRDPSNFLYQRSLSPAGVLKKRSPSPIKRSPSPSVSFKRDPSPQPSKRTPSPGDVFTSRKEQLDRENKARANKGEALKAVENRSGEVRSKSPNTAVSRNNSTLQSRPKLPAVCTSPSKKRNRARKLLLARTAGNKGRSESPLVQQPLPLVSVSRPSSSSIRSDSSARWRPKSGTSSSSTASVTTRHTGAVRRVVSSAPSGRSSPGGRNSKLRVCPRWGGSIPNTDRNNNSSTSSNTGIVKRTSSARRRAQHMCWPVENLNVPEHDRRILESMAMKREEERAAEDLAYEAHLAWEQARLHREQEQWHHAQLLREQVAEKRRVESANNERKMAELREEEQRAQLRLQQNLLEKEVRSATLMRSASDRKCGAQGERAEAIERQRAAVLWAREQLQQEKDLWRTCVQQELSEKQQRAEQARIQNKDLTRRRVASANRVEELRHAERRRIQQAEAEETMRAHRARCREKEMRAQHLLQKTSVDRERQIKGLSEARASRLHSARELHAELEAGFARWREQCSTLQQEASVRAEKRAIRQQRERRQRAEAANRAREEHHSLIMSRVSAEQRAIEDARRSAILSKEDKMRRLQHKREQEVHESRAQAHTTAELRDQIRRTIFPETFDRLVARSALEARVTASRPPTANPPPASTTRSHILLG